jgi:parallel beta-helix repeat protein
LYNNTVANNVREGICIEVSFGGKVFNNTVSGTVAHRTPIARTVGSGMPASASTRHRDVEVYGNALKENFQGIVIIQQPRNTSTGDSMRRPVASRSEHLRPTTTSSISGSRAAAQRW